MKERIEKQAKAGEREIRIESHTKYIYVLVERLECTGVCRPHVYK